MILVLFLGGRILRAMGLDEFPQLIEALRDGDLLTARSLCAQLFGIDRLQRSDAAEAPIARRTLDSTG